MINYAAIYGLYVFLLLHHDGSDRMLNKLIRVERIILNDAPELTGLSVGHFESSEHVYLKLCSRFGIEPEATL